MIPKPEPWKRVKARRKRAELKTKQDVRVKVAARDGYCRLYVLDEGWRTQLWKMFGPCGGASEWAHLRKRSLTRRMDPEVRHSTATSVMFCGNHHQHGRCAHERHTLDVAPLTEKGADGPLRFRAGEHIYEETE